jgi:hypothetical protein
MEKMTMAIIHLSSCFMGPSFGQGSHFSARRAGARTAVAGCPGIRVGTFSESHAFFNLHQSSDSHLSHLDFI